MRTLMTEALRALCDAAEGPGGFERLVRRLGLEGAVAEEGGVLPEASVWRLAMAAAERSSISVETLFERCGAEGGSSLLERGVREGVIAAHWNGLDLMEHLGEVLGAVPGETLELRSFRVHAGEVALALFRGRGFCRFLHGLARGAERHFGDALLMQEPLCQLRGARFCRFSIRFADRERARRVDPGREFEQLRKNGGRVIFHNIFKGVSLTHPGRVIDRSGDDWVAQTCGAQLKAMAFAGKSHLTVPHLPVGMAARVRRVDLVSEMAILGELRLCNGPVGFRRHPRVMPNHALPVRLEVEGETFSGRLLDLSENGAAVEVPARGRLERFLFAPFLLQFTLPLETFESGEILELGPRELLLQANLLDLQKSGGENLGRFVLSNQTSLQAALIRQFVSERERGVLPELADDVENGGPE